MTSRYFCYWLQGFFELQEGCQTNVAIGLNNKQIGLIKKHLSMVFKHEIDPSYGTKPEQDVLNNIHNNTPVGGPLIRC